MELKKLGETLKARRIERGMALAALSERSGVDSSHICRIEKGKRLPSALVLNKLARPLGFSEAEMLRLAGYLPPDETDDRIAKFKEAMRGKIKTTMANLLDKVDSL